MIVGILILALCCTSMCLAFSIRKNLQLLDRLEVVGDAVDAALDLLDEQHQKIDLKSRVEVFSDEPVVRELVSDIFVARNSVLEVARILNSSLVEEDDEPEEEQTKT